MSESNLQQLVSIITPCYNAAPFVAETIESVAAQAYPHIEHILVDDGSTDGSWEVIQRYADRVTAVRLEQNRGGSYARNRGAERARGEFLMFLDADDLISPDAIDALVETAREEPGTIAFCEWKRLRRIDGIWQRCEAEVVPPTPGTDHLRGWMESKSWVPPCAVLWRRDVYNTTGGWDESLSLNDDGDLMMGALISGAHLVPAERGIAYYRNHADERVTVSSDWFSEGKLRSQQRVLDKIVERLELQGRLDGYAGSLARLYHQLAFIGYTDGFKNLARDCEQRGNAFGTLATSRTALGRLLVLLMGLERKEQLLQWLAGQGIATGQRRELIRKRSHLRDLHRGESKSPSGAPLT